MVSLTMSQNLFIILFLFSQSAFATIDITKVTGASAFKDGSSPEIWGGTGGDTTGCSDDESTCNTCQENTLEICNPKAIFNELKLRIEFNDDSTSGEARVTLNGETIDVVSGDSTDNTSKNSGETHVLEIEWEDICDVVIESDCETLTDTSDNKTLKIGVGSGDDDEFESELSINLHVMVPPADGGAGISGNTIDICSDPSGGNGISGLCDWKAYPGDEKIYLEGPGEELSPATHNGSGFPTSHGTTIQTIRVIYSNETFDSSVLNPREAMDAGNYLDLNFSASDDSSTPSFSSNAVDGLTNGETYYFRVMSVDDSGNILDITDDQVYTEAVGTCVENSGDGTDVTVFNAFDCSVTAVPDEVVGLLSEDLNCFIATAAHGSSFADKIKDFRRFRKYYLLPNELGRTFNRAYYKYGSRISTWMQDKEWAKALARKVLMPAWMFAKASLEWGLWLASALALLIFGMIFSLFYYASRIGRQR